LFLLNQKARFFSFDVFDTCLVRDTARPSDLFFLLATKMLQNKDLPISRSMVSAVASLRLRAEQLARSRCNAEDLEIDAIYKVLPELDTFGFDAGIMMRQELCLEKQSLHPVPVIAKRIDVLRRKGRHIVFISDMYLPERFVRECLEEHGLALPGDSVFVSGSVGKTKHTGNLFRHVLDVLGVAPQQLLHCGDNIHTDVEMPRSLGVRVEPFHETKFSHEEQMLLNLGLEHSPEISTIVGAGRLCRLKGESSISSKETASVVANIIAPVLTGFVFWALNKAQRNGWKRLYFVSRDGQVLLRIAEEILKKEDFNIECRYLYGSRQAWFLPAMERFNLEIERSWLFVPGHSCAPVDILRKLNLTPKDLQDIPGTPSFDDQFWQKQPKNNDMEPIEKLMRSRPFAMLAEDKASKARQAANTYFEQEGLLDGRPIVLVDVGWTLKTQKALRTCLTHRLPKAELHGLYLGVQLAHIPDTEMGAFDAYIIEQERHFDSLQRFNAIFRNANCIEQIFTAGDYGQVTGYGLSSNVAFPIYSDPPYPERLAMIRQIQEQVRIFASLLADRPVRTWHHRHVRTWITELLRQFLSCPTRHQAMTIAALPIFDDQNESRSRPLAREIGFSTLIGLLTGHKGGEKRYSRSFDWIEGSIALSPRALQPLLRHPFFFERLRKYRMNQ
jgi:predicted HAD superfamily hydrolase